MLLTLIVSLAMCGSIFAQVQYGSHWPNFYYPAYGSQTPFVAAIEIDGEIITADHEGWDALEIAFFVGDECRGAGVAFGDYHPEVNFLYNGYVEEYGDPFPVIDGAPVYYDNAGEVFTVRMYDHLNNIEYNECSVTLLGEPFVLYTGEDNDQGWFDPENPIILHFTTPAAECEKILVNEQIPVWSESFEEEAADITTLWTGVTPACWTVAEQYFSASANGIGEGIDTLPQIYRNFNTTDGGHYSLRMHYRSLLAMPELDESVNLGNVRLSMYVRQSYWRYKLQVGVITDIENPDESFVPVALINNPDNSNTYFECGFSSVRDLVGEGRYIAFKNVGSSENDPYCVNYIDDVTLTYVSEESCFIDNPPYEQDFEGFMVGMEPECWEVITEDVALESTTRPQVYGGFNTTEGGSKSLRLKNRCVYAMPELIEPYGVRGMVLTFNLRQPKSIYRLQVGYLDEQGNFTVYKTLKCNGTEYEEKTVSFSGLTDMGHRIAFRNTLVPGTGMRTDYLDYSINYIDDISLAIREEDEEYKVDGNDEVFGSNSDLMDITVYPNPTTGVLYIDAMGVQKVECYSQMGQLVRVYDNANEISLGGLADGVYMLRITVPQGVTTRKVVKR